MAEWAQWIPTVNLEATELLLCTVYVWVRLWDRVQCAYDCHERMKIFKIHFCVRLWAQSKLRSSQWLMIGIVRSGDMKCVNNIGNLECWLCSMRLCHNAQCKCTLHISSIDRIVVDSLSQSLNWILFSLLLFVCLFVRWCIFSFPFCFFGFVFPNVYFYHQRQLSPSELFTLKYFHLAKMTWETENENTECIRYEMVAWWKVAMVFNTLTTWNGKQFSVLCGILVYFRA